MKQHIVTQKGQLGVLLPDARQQPQFHPVTIGFTADKQTQVIQGLRPGDLVFAHPPKVPTPPN